MSIGPVTAEAFEQFARAAAAVTDPSARCQLAAVADQVNGPFVIAVAGRLKAGKSTLVNALLGRAVAPTDAGECTRIITRFLRGDSDYVESIDASGATVSETRLGSGPVPADIAHPGVVRLDVHLTSAFLDGLVIADTPGRESLVGDNALQADQFLDLASLEAAKQADGVIYVIDKPVLNAAGVDTIERFVASVGDRHGLSSFVVCNKADHVTGGFEVASALAAKLAAGPLRSKVAGVVPVSAIALQAARCGMLDSATALDIAALEQIDGSTLGHMLRSERSFTGFECDVPGERRDRLVKRLGLTGIGVVLQHLRDRPGDYGGAVAVLEQAGNAEPLNAQLQRLRRRADSVKGIAAGVLAERIAWHGAAGADRATILTAVKSLRENCDLLVQQIKVLEHIQSDPDLASEEEAAELDSLFTPGPAQTRRMTNTLQGRDLEAFVMANATRWQAVQSSEFDPTRQHLAGVARRTYLAMLTVPMRAT